MPDPEIVQRLREKQNIRRVVHELAVDSRPVSWRWAGALAQRLLRTTSTPDTTERGSPIRHGQPITSS